MKFTIPKEINKEILNDLKAANIAFQKSYPGDGAERQPVHSVYGGAQLFKMDTTQKMGKVAIKNLQQYAPNFVVFAKALKLVNHEQLPNDVEAIAALVKNFENGDAEEMKAHPAWLPYAIYNKVQQKLVDEPVEDFRIDFEDGFGNRPDDEEDATAVFAAEQVAAAMKEGTLPPFIGIRIKPFTEELKQRSLRTLDLFVTTLLEACDYQLPPNFVVTLPKVTIPEQVKALVHAFNIMESLSKLEKGSLKMEIMVETTQSIMGLKGENALRHLVDAAKGRCIAAHFGTYDYTASYNITAKYQDMAHQACDFAHHMMKVALSGTGVWLSDGATNIMPVGPHRGDNLTAEQKQENRETVHRAWKIAYDHTRHSLWKGLYQGWDLHPAQLPIRYAAVYSFFLESYDQAAERLRNFMDTAAQATLSGEVFDDAATGQGLLNYFLRGMNCGAITKEEALASGLSIEELQSRSFAAILKNRRATVEG